MRLAIAVLFTVLMGSAVFGAQNADNCRPCWILKNGDKYDYGSYCATQLVMKSNSTTRTIIRFIHKYHVTSCARQCTEKVRKNGGACCEAKKIRDELMSIVSQIGLMPDQLVEYCGVHPHLELTYYKKEYGNCVPKKEKCLLQ